MNDTTIEDLKRMSTPQSPQKCSQKLTCAILTKSPLRPTKNGSMFSLSLCDKDPSSTLRAVCFNEDMFSKFETTGIYDFQKYKLKKGFGSLNQVELLIDQFTMVEKAEIQLKIKGSSFTISQILRGETQGIRFINLKAKVTSFHSKISAQLVHTPATKAREK